MLSISHACWYNSSCTAENNAWAKKLLNWVLMGFPVLHVNCVPKAANRHLCYHDVFFFSCDRWYTWLDWTRNISQSVMIPCLYAIKPEFDNNHQTLTVSKDALSRWWYDVRLFLQFLTRTFIDGGSLTRVWISGR